MERAQSSLGQSGELHTSQPSAASSVRQSTLYNASAKGSHAQACLCRKLISELKGNPMIPSEAAIGGPARGAARGPRILNPHWHRDVIELRGRSLVVIGLTTELPYDRQLAALQRKVGLAVVAFEVVLALLRQPHGPAQRAAGHTPLRCGRRSA